MSTGVHFAHVLRNIVRLVLLENRQCIHIGTDGDQLATFANLCESGTQADDIIKALESVCDHLNVTGIV